LCSLPGGFGDDANGGLSSGPFSLLSRMARCRNRSATIRPREPVGRAANRRGRLAPNGLEGRRSLSGQGVISREAVRAWVVAAEWRARETAAGGGMPAGDAGDDVDRWRSVARRDLRGRSGRNRETLPRSPEQQARPRAPRRGLGPKPSVAAQPIDLLTEWAADHGPATRFQHVPPALVDVERVADSPRAAVAWQNRGRTGRRGCGVVCAAGTESRRRPTAPCGPNRRAMAIGSAVGGLCASGRSARPPGPAVEECGRLRPRWVAAGSPPSTAGGGGGGGGARGFGFARFTVAKLGWP